MKLKISLDDLIFNFQKHSSPNIKYSFPDPDSKHYVVFRNPDNNKKIYFDRRGVGSWSNIKDISNVNAYTVIENDSLYIVFWSVDYDVDEFMREIQKILGALK